MRMTERKQDALGINFLEGLLDSNEPDLTAKAAAIHLEVRPKPVVNSDQSLGHLANRIEEEVRVSTPRQLAKNVLMDAGILQKKPSRKIAVNSHLRHVGQRSKKISLHQQTKVPVRRVKRQVVHSRQQRRTAPSQTRNRPSVGMEFETPRTPRKQSKSEQKNRRRKSFFRR
ncbi:MAG: hypothetical protein CMA63_06440 [Euryarchaeota archaeon]|nr:hypothetical protein [Euryarchaeota archaeon]